MMALSVESKSWFRCLPSLQVTVSFLIEQLLHRREQIHTDTLLVILMKIAGGNWSSETAQIKMFHGLSQLMYIAHSEIEVGSASEKLCLIVDF